MPKDSKTTYEQTVRKYLKNPQERHLYQVAEIGHQMLRENIAPENLVEMHVDVMADVLRRFPWKTSGR